MSGMNTTPHHIVPPAYLNTDMRPILREGKAYLVIDDAEIVSEADFLPGEADSAIVVARRSGSDTHADSPASTSQ